MQERELIEQIRNLVGENCQQVLQGIGDDCAVLKKNSETVWLVTMDTLVESVHFDASWHPPELLGRKAVSVNVSDIAAMGGKPCFVLLSLGLPAGFDHAWAKSLTTGITSGCRQYGCMLVGGDTVCSPEKVVLTITVIGEMAANKVLYRQGAKLDDTIWVTGNLGSAAAGLALFQKKEPQLLVTYKPFVQKHLDPRARVNLAEILAQTGLVHSMMDISDGLATDLSHLCQQSNVGARVIADQLPAHPLLAEAAKHCADDPLQWMVSGGEDYELVFTAPPRTEEALKKLARNHDFQLFPIGTIVKGNRVVLGKSADMKDDEQVISYQGFDHFS